MKYLMTAALALSLVAGSAAYAQDHDRDRGGDRGGREHDRGPGGPGGPGGERGGPRPQGGPRVEGERGGPRGDDRRGPGGDDRRDFDRRGPGGPGPGFDHRGPGGGPRPGFDRRGPEPGFRPGFYLRDRGWHGGRYRAPFYRYPSGWGYRRWAFGSFLPGAFLGPDFFLGSYWTYGLPAPPPGYHWIRVGPDALLVRYGDGYVLDAAYGIFY